MVRVRAARDGTCFVLTLHETRYTYMGDPIRSGLFRYRTTAVTFFSSNVMLTGQ
jgi:hypothetical protein